MRMSNRIAQHCVGTDDKTTSRGSILDKIKTIRYDRMHGIIVRWNPKSMGLKNPEYDVVRELDKDLEHAYQTEILDHAMELFKVWVDEAQKKEAHLLFGKRFCDQSHGLKVRANLTHRHEILVYTVPNNSLLFTISPASQDPSHKTQQRIEAFYREFVKMIPPP